MVDTMRVDYYPDELPRPAGYGMVGPLRLPKHEPELPKVLPPEQAFRDMPKPQQFKVPDLVTVRNGAGDPAVVGDLLRAANGEPTQKYQNIPATYAAKLLQSFGYPTTMDAWTADEWKAAIDANKARTEMIAGMLAPVQPMGY